MFTSKVQSIAEKTQGKLVVKEYPTGQANASHFRALLNELKLKKNFVPDIIYIDYLNICASSRMKSMGGAINSHTYIKSIAEELRGSWNSTCRLCLQHKRLVLVTLMMTWVGGASESFDYPQTLTLCCTYQQRRTRKQRTNTCKQLKNRYNDPTTYQRFVVGIDRSKMRLFDVDQNDSPLNQEEDTGPAFDNTSSGERVRSERFEGFRI